MTRQSISLTKQNDEWLKSQVLEDELNNKSEAISYLIKHARNQEAYYDFVRMKIEKGGQSVLAKIQTRDEMLAEINRDLPDV